MPRVSGLALEPAAAHAGRVVAGDALRALAALSVVVYHVAYTVLLVEGTTRGPGAYESHYGDIAGPLLRNLDLGLYVFFVLSGYLIGRPFVHAFLVGDAHPRVLPYLRNRALRIVPAFWAVFTILLIRNGAEGSSAAELAAVYGFAQNHLDSPAASLVGQAWTLDVEVLYYLAVPLVALLVVAFGGRRLGQAGRRRLVWALLALVFAGALALSELLPQTLEAKRSFPAMAFAFVPGLALAVAEIDLAPRVRGWRHGRAAALTLVVGGLVACAVYSLVLGRRLGFHPTVGAGPRAAAAVAAGLLVAAPLVLQWAQARTWRVLDNPVARGLGRWSYSIYLVHLGLILEVERLLPDRSATGATLLLWLLVALPLVVAAGAAGYRLFERPFLERRRRWRG